jgi:hypothetical protein
MSTSRALAAALERLLRPLVQLMIRNGIAHGAFADIAKRVYVQVAAEEERIAGRKQTVSRMAILTGLTRKEVARLLKTPTEPAEEMAARYNRAARVITGWIRDERYLDEKGDPRRLPLEGEGSTFAGLVKTFSGDVPPRAILDELERVGAVRREEDGLICLQVRGYLPRHGEAEKLQILGTDVAGLISTIRHNLDGEHDGPGEPASGGAFFQRKVFYDNLSADCLPDLRNLSAKKGQALLEMLDRWMSEHDMDGKPDPDGRGGHRAGIGIYYFEENDESPETL